MAENITTITLPDHRTLAFAEYGQPQGKPVFFFHGIPGSRLFRPPDEITRRLSVRLITIDRPGFAFSTYLAHRRIPDWPRDLAILADHLTLDTFHVAGHSGGAPYALASACLLPGRVRGAAVLSGAGPIDSPGALKAMTPLNRLGFSLGRFIPWPIWRLLVWALYHRGHKDPAYLFDRASADRPAADTAILSLPGVLELNYASQSDALRSGTRGFALEVRLLANPWGFDLEHIHCPIHIWHGTADVDTPVAMAHAVAARIPTSRLTICPGEGHMLLFPHWEEILTSLFQE